MLRTHECAANLHVMQHTNGDRFLSQVTGNVKWVLRTEGLAVLTAALLVYGFYGFSWATFFMCFLLPDLSLLGYLFGKKVGAISYNCAHSYIGPAIFISFAFILGEQLYQLICLIWAAHIGFDRTLGYGLKYQNGFSYTHLGKIGKEKGA